MQEESADVLSCESCNTGADGSLSGTDVKSVSGSCFLQQAGSVMVLHFQPAFKKQSPLILRLRGKIHDKGITEDADAKPLSFFALRLRSPLYWTFALSIQL